MSPDWNLIGEGGGWVVGFAGFALAMYGVFVGTGGGQYSNTLLWSGGFLLGGLVLSLVGIAVAMTFREHRGSGHIDGTHQNEDIDLYE